MRLDNYLSGRWAPGTGDGLALIDPVEGIELACASTKGVDIASALSYARAVGGPALRMLSYAERAGLLSKRALRFYQQIAAIQSPGEPYPGAVRRHNSMAAVNVA